MRVIVGSDHAGYELKEYLKERLETWGHSVEDVGTHSADSCDYPEFGAKVARRVVELEEGGKTARGARQSSLRSAAASP